jgi:anti-sigma B factor antagonist
MAYFKGEGLPPGMQRVGAGGEIDLHAKKEFEKHVGRALATNPDCLVVDLTEATFIDSTGVSVLVSALRRIRANGGRVELVCTNPNVLRVFEIAGLERLFPIHDSLDELLAVVAAPA